MSSNRVRAAVIWSVKAGHALRAFAEIPTAGRRLLYGRPIVVLLFLFLTAVAVITWHTNRQQLAAVEARALRSAERLSITLAEFRTIYTSEVVERVRSQGISVTHDYEQREGAIPLPATLSMMLGNQIGATNPEHPQTRLYSAFPFPWRRADGGLADDFAADAWEFLTKKPDAPFYRFEELGGVPVLRYATADLMRAACVNCHNTHPDSPKTDWKVGDVRGVLEVIAPLAVPLAESRSGLTDTAILMLLMTLGGLLVMGAVLGHLRRVATEAKDSAKQTQRANGRLEREVTERQHAEEALRDAQNMLEGRIKRRTSALEKEKAELHKKEQRIRTLIDTMTDGVITIDSAGIVRSANPAALEQFGCELTEILGQEVNILMPEEFACEHDTYISNYLQTGDAKIIGTQRELTGRRRDGSTFPLELSVSEMVIYGEHTFTGHIRDITERKNAEAERVELERELSQAQKLESLGTLAGGIAHEINTPVQFIGDNTRFLKSAFVDLSAVLEKHLNLLEAATTNNVLADAVAEANAAAEAADMGYLVADIPTAIEHSLEGLGQIAEIVKAIKDFSYPNTKEKCPADINKAITTTITVSRNQWKYAAELETEFDTTLPLVPCLLGEFNQVILNLIVNAAHAIQDNGKESKGRIAISTRRIEDWAEICISDTGAGIPKENYDKIFEPFFTTKEPGKGTGQGLAISRTIITKKHGGTFRFQSEVGEGTVFIIRLPLVDHDQSEVAA